jgi:hypothetical protein
MANASAAAIAAKLAGHPVRPHGGNFLVRCPVHDDQSPSLSIRDGDDGRLLVHCFAGCDPLDVLSEIRARIGNIRAHVETSPKPAKRSSAYERGQNDKARWLWSRRKPITGSIAETYLRHARGYAGPMPPTFGHLPAHDQYDHALICAFGIPDEIEPGVLHMPDDAVRGVHLIRLNADGCDRIRDRTGKITIGRCPGAPIVCAPYQDSNNALAIAEGVENALSAHAAMGIGAWAAGGASRLPALADAVPDFVECITIVVDDDDAGRQHCPMLAQWLHERGYEVRLVPPFATGGAAQ